MRAVAVTFIFFALLSFGWAVQIPLSTSVRVWQLAQPDADEQAVQAALIRIGVGAQPQLRAGLEASERHTRMRCAQTLMLMGEVDGEEFLFNELRKHGDDGLGRETESRLLAAWDRREGPDDFMRRKLRQAEEEGLEKSQVEPAIRALNDCLARYQNWADGFARRAKLYRKHGDEYLARRDALTALSLAPNHFEALVTLGRTQMYFESPQVAYRCFERAILLNPRMKEDLKKEVREALDAIDAEKKKKREEKRKATPLV